MLCECLSYKQFVLSRSTVVSQLFVTRLQLNVNHVKIKYCDNFVIDEIPLNTCAVSDPACTALLSEPVILCDMKVTK
jgi:hypothetical protein